MKIEVTAFPRAQQGSGASRRLRVAGRVPGVLYGASKPTQNIELDEKALLRQLGLEAFHASILDLTLDGNREQVLLRDYQMHPWRKRVLHVDFQRIDKNRKIHMKVPLHFVNGEICPGVKTGGGVVQQLMNEINIQCLPDDLPEFIEVDLVNMEVGQALHLSEMVMPKGVEPVAKLRLEDPAIVSVQIPKEIVIEEEVAAPVTEIIGEVPAEGEEAAEAVEGERKEPPAEKKEKEGGKKEKEGGKKEKEKE
jgi:large subunit ribosomal protein L25